MKFCTTCGRTYDDMAIDMCPHDGTPLFSMAGEEPEPEESEAQGSRAAAGAFESAMLDERDREEMAGALAEVSEFAREEMRHDADDALGLLEESSEMKVSVDDPLEEDPYADLPAPLASRDDSYDDLPVPVSSGPDSDDLDDFDHDRSLADDSSEELAMPAEQDEDPYADLPAPLVSRDDSYDDLPVPVPVSSGPDLDDLDNLDNKLSVGDDSSEELAMPVAHDAGPDLFDEDSEPSVKGEPGFTLPDADDAASLQIDDAIGDAIGELEEPEEVGAPLAFTPDVPAEDSFSDSPPARRQEEKSNVGRLVLLLLLALAAVAGWYFFMGPGSTVGTDPNAPDTTSQGQQEPATPLPPTAEPNNLVKENQEVVPAMATASAVTATATAIATSVLNAPGSAPQGKEAKPVKKTVVRREPARKPQVKTPQAAKPEAEQPQPKADDAEKPAPKTPAKPSEEALKKELNDLIEE